MRWQAWMLLALETVAWVMPPVRVPARSDRTSVIGLQIDGITIGPVIWQVGDEFDRCTDAHELEHVNQWRRETMLVFYLKYGFYYLKSRTGGLDPVNAYLSIPYERAAYGVCDSSMVESDE